MTDPRYQKLAKLLVAYSTALKKGDRALLDLIDVPDEFSIELIRAVRAAGAVPFAEVRHTRVSRELLLAMTGPQAAQMRDTELFRMKKMQAYIAIRGSGNASENADVQPTVMALYSRVTRPVHDYRVNKTRWCVLRWPTPSMAQAAGMSTEAFEDFYFHVCTMDYAKWHGPCCRWKDDEKGRPRPHQRPGDRPAFSIKGSAPIMCYGEPNIPDGEVFSCPVENP